MSKLFKNTSSTRLLLDRRTGSRSSYSVSGVGSVTPGGQPLDVLEVEDADLALPGIAKAISDGLLVPFAGYTKESLKAARDEATAPKGPEVKAEAPVKPSEPVKGPEASKPAEPVKAEAADSKKEGGKKDGK